MHRINNARLYGLFSTKRGYYVGLQPRGKSVKAICERMRDFFKGSEKEREFTFIKE